MLRFTPNVPRRHPCFTEFMARPLRLHVPGMLHHVISRGNARQIIFEDDQDYERYLDLLGRACRRFRVRCFAYCLIRNHLHLLLQPSEIPISRMMQVLNSVYCQGFNRRHGRVGHVLQGRYKDLLVESPDYFLTVLRYIVLNPVEAKLVNHPADWCWSSFRATAGLETCPSFLHVEEIWGAFNAPDERGGQESFVEYVNARPVDPLPERVLIFGSDAFVRSFRSRLLPHRKVDAFVRAERYADRPPLSQLIHDTTDRTSLALAARRAFQDYAYTLSEIGRHVSRAPGTVWSWIHRIAHRFIDGISISESAASGTLRHT